MTEKKTPNMHSSWLNVLGDEFEKSYMSSLRSFLKNEKSQNKEIFPPSEKTFSALRLTPLESVKVVIIGQDPYHGKGQANGLAFSVDRGTSIPPSLTNIYKEISSDLKLNTPNHGDLSDWATQGVLLLNSVLTVERGNPASHANKGWETFTDKIIEILNKKTNIVFLLWGGYAQKKGLNINPKLHLILKAPHPSPLSAHRGFFGSRHFSLTNDYLRQKGKKEVDWVNQKTKL